MWAAGRDRPGEVMGWVDRGQTAPEGRSGPTSALGGGGQGSRCGGGQGKGAARAVGRALSVREGVAHPLTLGAAHSDMVLSGTGDRAPGHPYALPQQLSCLQVRDRAHGQLGLCQGVECERLPPGPNPPPSASCKALTGRDYSCGGGHLTALQQGVEGEAVLGARLQPVQPVAGHIGGQHHLLGHLPTCKETGQASRSLPSLRAHLCPALTALTLPLQPVATGLRHQVPGKEDGCRAQDNWVQGLLDSTVCQGTGDISGPGAPPIGPAA